MTTIHEQAAEYRALLHDIRTMFDQALAEGWTGGDIQDEILALQPRIVAVMGPNALAPLAPTPISRLTIAIRTAKYGPAAVIDACQTANQALDDEKKFFEHDEERPDCALVIEAIQDAIDTVGEAARREHFPG